MKRKIISHGSRHRTGWHRRHFRRENHKDDAIEDHQHGSGDEEEFDEWYSEHIVCPCCDPAFAATWVRKLVLLLKGGWAEVSDLQGKVAPGLWEELHQAASDKSEKDSPYERQPWGLELHPDELADDLHAFFSQMRDADADPRAFVMATPAEVRLGQEILQRLDWCQHTPHFEHLESVLGMVLLLKPYWLRNLEEWDIPERIDNKAVGNLLRHLFARYPVPDWLVLGGWGGARYDWKWPLWLVVLGAGA